MASFKEIQAQIAQLEQQAAEQHDREFAGAVEEIRTLMQVHGITVDDLQSARTKRGVKKSGAVLFRNAETGNTWSGRGRMPNWLSGQDREHFRV
jgi:DNA-binding protein H-NS